MKKIIFLLILLLFTGHVSANAETLTLDQFLDKVFKHSKDLKLSNEDSKYAKATKREAVSGALPSVSASAGYNRNLSDYFMFVDFGDGPSKLKINKDNEYNLNVTVNQALFNGSVYNAIKAARQYSKLTEYMYQASENEIMTVAKKSFYQALLLNKVFKVAEKSEENALENYNETKSGFENGLKSEFEKLQAEVRYKELIPQTTAAGRNYNISILYLKNMAGINPDEELYLQGNLIDYPQPPADIKIENILNQRPDYNAIVWEEKLRKTGVSADKAGRLPSLNGFFRYNYSAQSDEFKFENENNSYVIGLNLSIPIFTGGKTSSKIQKSKIELSRSSINKNRMVDNIRTEAANIRLRLTEAFSRIESAKSSFETAKKAFKIAMETSNVGLSTQLELKDSRVVLDQAEVYYYSAIYEYLDAYFDWDKATGKVIYGKP